MYIITFAHLHNIVYCILYLHIIIIILCKGNDLGSLIKLVIQKKLCHSITYICIAFTITVLDVMGSK